MYKRQAVIMVNTQQLLTAAEIQLLKTCLSWARVSVFPVKEGKRLSVSLKKSAKKFLPTDSKKDPISSSCSHNNVLLYFNVVHNQA